MSGIRVLGLDLSLTATGLAEVGTNYTASTLKPGKAVGTGYDRLDWILGHVRDVAHEYADGHLVVVEGPAYGAKGSAVHQIAGLWWLITHHLWLGGIDFAVVPPAALKRYATGKGNAGKDEVLLATARRFPDFDGDNNAADALWLAAMGADHAGQPIAAMPATNREALVKVEWPMHTTKESP